MKIFAIRNENDLNKDLAYLFYYEKAKTFYIEIPSDIDAWDLPIILSSFARTKEFTVDSNWSKIWVQQRIIPSDRQNLGHILRDNKLKEYDEYKLLRLTKGRCEQDDCFISPILENELPKEILHRMDHKIEYVIPLTHYRVIVFFKNNKTKICDVTAFFEKMIGYNKKYEDYSVFESAGIEAGGYGLTWGSNINVSSEWLISHGKTLSLSKEDLKLIIDNGTVNSADAAEMIGCSRQNIDDLIKRDKLKPVKVSGKNKLFLRDDVAKYVLEG